MRLSEKRAAAQAGLAQFGETRIARRASVRHSLEKGKKNVAFFVNLQNNHILPFQGPILQLQPEPRSDPGWSRSCPAIGRSSSRFSFSGGDVFGL